MNIFATLLFGSTIAFNFAKADSNPIPDFTVVMGQSTKAPSNWLLEFHPPAHHHFNLKAPMKVTSGESAWLKVGANDQKIGYKIASENLKEGGEIKASFFLCDEALTYCVSKTLDFKLKASGALHELSFSAPASSATPSTPKTKKIKKDEFGFWDNDLPSALEESQQSGKPLLVDFYGIWCPPCNRYNETVFNQKEFRTISKKWVLLKMDADRDSSFPLKSHFKIGGYPTLSLIQAPKRSQSGEAINSLQEIDRIVGYFPIVDFSQRLNEAFAVRNQTLEERLAHQESQFLSNLKKLVEIRLEQKEPKETLELLSRGLALDPKNTFFGLIKLEIESADAPSLLKLASTLDLLKAIHEHRDNETSETLMHAQDLLISHADSFSRDQLLWAKDYLDTLQKRVNPETLSVDGVELSIGDLAVDHVDLFKALKDDQGLKSAYQEVVESDRKLIALEPHVDSRGINLELAHYLFETGKVDEAKQTYAHFIEKYPHEFTFYFAAANLYVNLKDLKTARDYAEKALQYSYGDNQIRSMDRLIRIMALQGEKTEALARGKKFIDETKISPELAVRTGRYVISLKKTLSDVEAGKI